MQFKTMVKVAGASHLVMTGVRALAAGGDAGYVTKFLYLLMLGDTPDVNVTSTAVVDDSEQQPT